MSVIVQTNGDRVNMVEFILGFIRKEHNVIKGHPVKMIPTLDIQSLGISVIVSLPLSVKIYPFKSGEPVKTVNLPGIKIPGTNTYSLSSGTYVIK